MRNLTRYFVILFLNVFVVLITIKYSSAQENKQDVVYLNNGSVLHGQIIEIKATESITLKSNCNDIWVINQADINRIVKEDIEVTDEKNKIKADFNYNKSGFYSNINVGFLFGGNIDTPFPPLSLTFVNGYRFDWGLQVGAGLGLELINETYMPVVLDLRYTFKKSKISHFIYIQGGYAFTLGTPDPYNYDYYNYNDTDLKSKGGYLINPGIGFKINLNEKNAFSFGVGYKYMEVTHTYNEYNGQEIERKIKYNRISLNFGYHF